jgi:tight adherence protein B
VGVLVGGLAGLGVFLCLAALAGDRPPASSGPWRRRRADAASLSARAGLPRLGFGRLVAGSAVAGGVTTLVLLAATGTVPLAVAFGLFAAAGPRAYLRRRARQRTADLREEWPDVVDNLASGVRAGLSLPEALGALAESGPATLRPAFARFAEAHRASGNFRGCLTRLADDLDDPVADRIVEALRLARDVGGTDLGGLLRTLAAFLREDARVRAEIEARQSWTVNAARLALAAPWAVLLLLATQTSTIEAYNRPSGVVVLVAGGGVSWAAYLLMRRLGRLPAPRRAGTRAPAAAPLGAAR